MPLVRKPGLAASGSAPAASDVIRALQSETADARWSAARSAASLPAAEEALARALAVESDSRVREAMLTSLARLGTRTSLEPVIRLVRSDEASLRTAALDALRLSPLLPQVIGALLEDADADVRLLSCDLVRELPSAEANSLLAALLSVERQPNVCAAAVEVLAEVGGPSSLKVLADCAHRFSRHEFLLFAIKTVVERINATSASARG